MPGPQLLGVRWTRDKPRQERTIFNQRLPSGSIPIHVLVGRHAGALATEKDHHGVRFGRNETKTEGILRPTVVAL